LKPNSGDVAEIMTQPPREFKNEENPDDGISGPDHASYCSNDQWFDELLSGYPVRYHEMMRTFDELG
jgi:hypothetical protein